MNQIDEQLKIAAALTGCENLVEEVGEGAVEALRKLAVERGGLHLWSHDDPPSALYGLVEPEELVFAGTYSHLDLGRTQNKRLVAMLWTGCELGGHCYIFTFGAERGEPPVLVYYGGSPVRYE